MKIIIDCNILIAAGLKDGLCRAFLKYALENCTIYLSENILLEYLRVIRRDKFKKHREILERFLSLLVDISEIVEEIEISHSLPDPSDKKYLRTAFAVDASLIITGNTKDFPEKIYEGIKILTPRDFMNLYGEEYSKV